MNDLTFKGSWNEVKGRLKKSYAGLTDDDLTYAEGQSDQLLGRLEIALGHKRDELRKIIADI